MNDRPTSQDGTTAKDNAGSALISDPLINLLIDGRYRVTSRMARGGMASVYVAQDERLDRPVALKVMHPHLAESEQFTARFRQEARAVAKISHPGVVPVFDQGAFHGQAYLVMELVDGPDLRTFINRHGPLSLETALRFTEEILDGLAEAHRVGVVHRDLKPENVLVASNGTLKIADFGLARAASEITLSSTGSILGTVAYLAPEVAVRGETDGRTDIYAAGIMLYEMLTGNVPGRELNNPVQMALARVKTDVPPPSNTTPWLPTEVDDLVASFCSRDQSQRPASASEAARKIVELREQLTEDQLATLLPRTDTDTENGGNSEQTAAMSPYSHTSILPLEPKVVHTSGSVTPPEEKQFPATSRKPMLIITFLMLLLAIALGVWWWWQQYGPGSYLNVPELSGMSLEQAEQRLEGMNLASTLEYDYSDEVTQDDIIATRPAAGERIHKRDEITLIVSMGIEMLTVPEISDIESDAAKTLLLDAGFEIGEVTEEWSEEIPAGNVISSNPSVGKTVPHTTLVNLVVSKGREPITVPDLTGRPTDEVVTALNKLGLVPEVVEIFSGDVETGLVVSFEPEVNTTLFRGETVVVYVSKGPEMLEVPNVYGRSRTEATEILQEAGFQVEVNKLAGFFDSVGSQSPRAGQLAPRNSVVEITVV